MEYSLWENKWKENYKKVIIFTLIVISAGFINSLLPKNMFHSTVTSGKVISKNYDYSQPQPFSIGLKVLSENTAGTEVVLILVEDQKMWESIEKDKFYFVNYSWKNSETPTLDQITINNEFGSIYKKSFE